MADVKNVKRIELGVNTKSVKVQFNTATKSFKDTIGSAHYAICEMADAQKIFANNVRILTESVDKLTEKSEKSGLTESEKTRLELDSADLKEYTDKFNAYRDEYNKRMNELYVLINKDIYAGYNTYARTQSKSDFEKALKVFLAEHNIECTPTLVKFLIQVVGLRKASANTKVKSKGGTLLVAQTERGFNDLFIHALCQLMVDKGAVSTTRYTFTYEKSTETKIDFEKIDSQVIEEPKTEEVKKEEPKTEKKTMTKTQIMECLDKAQIKYTKRMKLSELFDLYKTIEVAESEDDAE